MDKSVNDSLFFFPTLTGYDFSAYPTHVVHILCLAGRVSFTVQRTRYHVSYGDYVIWTDGVLVTDISQSDDYEMLAMSFNGSIAAMSAIRSNYGIIGHLSLLQNPVIRLNSADFAKCRADLLRLRERVAESSHLFHDELIATLLKAHILDLYDIHARANTTATAASRPAALMRAFIGMLIDGDYQTHRSLAYFSSRLCITPHYLTEISNSLSRRPASYWIDRFLVRDIVQLLVQKNLPLSEIAYRLNFASVSYLSRYVSKHLGITPSDFRKSLHR